MKEVVEFFHMSSKRNFTLKSILEKGLKSFCNTRWVEKYETILEFQTNFKLIIATLEEITNWRDITSSSKANMLLKSLLSIDFVISLNSMVHFFSLSLPLSKLLQKETMDLHTASDMIQSMLSALKSQRLGATMEFQRIWQNSCEIANELDIPIGIPRLAKKQTLRNNYPTSSPEEYFRLSVFIPYIDTLITDIEARFPPEIKDAFNLCLLLPHNIISIDDEKLRATFTSIWKFYYNLLCDKVANNAQEIFIGEIVVWKFKWIQEQKTNVNFNPNKTVIDVFNECNEEIYPNVKQLLSILLTLPVTTASAERSFSSRRLKTWLRNRMSEERLTGLALMHIHQNIEIDIEKVIDRFAKTKKRQLQFVV